MKTKFTGFLFKKFGMTILLALSYTTAGIKEKKCFTGSGNSCRLLCTNWNLSSYSDIKRLKEIINTKELRYATCALTLESCTYSNNTYKIWNEIFSENSPKINNLKIFNSQIDLNEIGLPSVRHLRSLTIKNTTTTALRLEILKLPHLRRLIIKRNPALKSVEGCLLHSTPVSHLQIQGVNLNSSEIINFFGNLSCGRDVPAIRKLDWSHNNFPNFTNNFLVNYPNLHSLILTNSNIFNVEGDAFQLGNVRIIRIDDNKIEKLPEKEFKFFQNASSVFLAKNLFACDCQMNWLRHLAMRKTHVFKDIRNAVCASPGNSSFLKTEMCPEAKQPFGMNHNDSKAYPTEPTRCPLKKNWQIVTDYMSGAETLARKFSVLNDDPEFIQVTLSDSVDVEKTFLWRVDFSNATFPTFDCFNIFKEKFLVRVKPDADYIVCLSSTAIILDCFPIKTKPLHENQTWLTNKSITLSIIYITAGFLFASAAGGLISYLSVHKNPSLIRGSKRVIEVKRHDKAQLLIMPRGYERANRSEDSSLALMGPRRALEPSASSLSSDTVSTVSYVSANQPTQLEILTYRLNRLREIFQRTNNDLPRPVPSLPVQISSPTNQRLPPDVDLLFEYEWYTITTTTTTQA